MPRRAAAPEAPASATGSDTGEAGTAPSPLTLDQQRQLLQELHQLREQVAGAADRAPETVNEPPETGNPRPPPRPPSPTHSRLQHSPDKRAPPEVDAVELSEDEDDVAENYDVGRPQHSSVSVASIIDLLRGDQRTLPLPHSPRNPYPRAPALQTRAGHYAPDSAGDSVHGKLHSSLQRIHKDVALELVRNELCTLVPVSSILYDLSEFLQDAAAMAAASPQLRGKEAEQLLRAALQQLSAARELNAERIAELRGAVRGSSRRHGSSTRSASPNFEGQCEADRSGQQWRTSCMIKKPPSSEPPPDWKTSSQHPRKCAPLTPTSPQLHGNERAPSKAALRRARRTRHAEQLNISAQHNPSSHAHAMMVRAAATAAEDSRVAALAEPTPQRVKAATRAEAVAAATASAAAKCLRQRQLTPRAAAASQPGKLRGAATLCPTSARELADPGAYSGPNLHQRTRSRLAEWARMGAPKRILSWLRDGVTVRWNERGEPPPFHHGVSAFSPAERAWLTVERDRCLASGAWAPATRCTHVSRAFVAYHKNKPRLVIDLRFINLHTHKLPCYYETLSTLRRLIRRGDWLFSIDLSDAYHHIPFHRDFAPFFTFGIEVLTTSGVVQIQYFHTPVLNFGWTNSPTVFTQFMRVPVVHIRRPHRPSRKRQHGDTALNAPPAHIRALLYLDEKAKLARGPSAHRSVSPF